MLISRRLAFTGTIKDLSKGFEGKCEAKDSLVVCFGEVLIDFVPTVGGVSLAEAPAFKKAPGGAPANVAVGMSRLGGSSAFIGKVQFHTLKLFTFNQTVESSNVFDSSKAVASIFRYVIGR